MSTLGDFAKNYGQNIIGGLAGGAVGGGLGAYTTSQEEGESPEEFKQRQISNATTGAIGGAAGGAALPYLAQQIAKFFPSNNPPTPPGIGAKMRDLINPASHVNTTARIEGAAIGYPVGAVATHAAMNPRKIPLIGGLLSRNPAGGSSWDPVLGIWRTKADDIAKTLERFPNDPLKDSLRITERAARQKLMDLGRTAASDEMGSGMWNPLRAFKDLPWSVKGDSMGGIGGAILGEEVPDIVHAFVAGGNK